ncbi:uncharacterized protein LOC119246446 isoform X2 [Talpa occidentalis]|uniref:uncharacterized protein LOC119246446 isoform X2 n=1 Tax=Talpa occidentalis TaxID=50954 RepID=UPI0023F7D224|nr:uncharacterized protein LOC119246446 isoform X2 [Talpa occidentalis]
MPSESPCSGHADVEGKVGPESSGGPPTTLHSAPQNSPAMAQLLPSDVKMLLLMSRDPGRYSTVTRRLWGHIFDSLVVGSLERMALGVSQLMRPQALGPVIRATAMLYFHLCPRCTVQHYEAALDTFWRPPVKPPTLVFYSYDDPLCDTAHLQELLASWQQAGMPVWAQAWETSRHAAHLRQHPLEYRHALITFLGRLGLVAPTARL